LSIKDRNARVENRNWILGEDPKTIEEARGVSSVRGVLAESVAGGVPGRPTVGATAGRAFPMPGSADDAPKAPTPPACSGTTKKGETCKAHPMRGNPFCIGHSRQ
jgi:hypothetical protein